MLAADLQAELKGRGIEFVALGREDLDITNLDQTTAVVARLRPAVIANCAAYTAVDQAEEDEAAAFLLNAVGPQNLAVAANNVGAKLLHVSTDYVFSGAAEQPYLADEPLQPLGAYGRTKAAGEWAAQANHPATYIVRTAWLYGAGGPCFPKTMARLLEEHSTVKVVDDQFGQPTWAKDVARVLVDLDESGAQPGVYHATSSGKTSWFGFTEQIARSLGFPEGGVEPVNSSQFVRPAPRPSYSVLDHQTLRAAGVEPIGDWVQRWQEAAPKVLGSL